jgi:hypothetical protein
MAICIKCHGRIDGKAYETKTELCSRLGKPYTPPKVCTECLVLGILNFAFDEDPDMTPAKNTEEP